MADVQLAIAITSDAGDAAKGFDKVGDSAKDMARGIEDVGRKADTAGSKINAVADGSDTLASKSSQATGALGALGSGMTLVGAEKYATQLETAALATDFLSGVGDALNLVMNAQALVTARATVSNIAHKAATVATSAATKAAAASQWLLNAALTANPIGIVVVAVIALVAGLVLAYKKSETFRGIINKVGQVGKAAITGVVDAVSSLVGWVRDKVPPAFQFMKDLVVKYVLLVTTPQRVLLGIIKDIYSWVREKVPAAFVVMKDKAAAIGDALLSPFRGLKDLIDDILDLIGKIKIPDLPDFDIPGLRTIAARGSGSLTPVAVAGGDTFNINFDGIVTDPSATARKIVELINRERRDRGLGGI